MPTKPTKKPQRGRPKGTTKGRKPCKSIAFDKDLLDWIDAMPGNRSTNLNAILRAAKVLADIGNVTKH